MRIAIFSECYTPVANGVVTSIEALRSTLTAWGHSVVVVAPGAPLPEDDDLIFRLPELPFPDHPYHLARPFPRLKVDFDALDIDVIHCQHPFTVGRLGAEIARKHRIPMVYTAHSLYDNMVLYARSRIVRKVGIKAARGVVRRFCSKASCVIAPSRHTREVLRSEGVTTRFAVVPSGVDGPHAAPGARDRIRARLGLTCDQPLILYVGRLGPEKRVDVMLRSFALLANSRKLAPEVANFRAVLVGDGQQRAALEELNEQLGLRERVIFAGAQPHATIGDWYASADVFALSSPMETQGLVLVEAMAAGLPCVAIDAGGPREVVVQGKTGLRVPLDPGAFSRALDLLLRDTEMRRTLGAAGRERALLYSPEAMARGVLNVYENVVRTYRPPRTSSASSRAVALATRPIHIRPMSIRRKRRV